MRRDEILLTDPPADDRPGSRWMCGRSDESPQCAHGPFGNGQCPLADACRPRRTWYGKRKQIVTVVLAFAALLTFVMSRPVIAPNVFKPGELSTPHAQILSGVNASDRCAACHPPAATMPNTWFRPDSEGHQRVTQLDRCLDCHHNVIRRDRANLAHNMLPAVLASLRTNIQLVSADSEFLESKPTSWHDLMPGPSVDVQNIQCSACHREHRGMKANLLDVSDSQCQTCHADRFGSFADSHPYWNRWPYGRGRAIAFDHQTHANKHYPSSQPAGTPMVFDCSQCHRVTSKGELARAPSYERACQACHDQSLELEAAEGLELLALPTVTEESATQLQPWPESATGFYDGQLAPIAELLLRADASTASAIRRIPNGNFGEVKSEDSVMVESATVVAEEHRQLLAEIAVNGQAAILSRAEHAGIRRDILMEMIRALPPQLLQQAYQHWFTDRSDPVLRNAALQSSILQRGLRLVEFRDIATLPPSLLIAARPDDNLLLAVDEKSDEPVVQDDLLMSDDDVLLTEGSDSDDLLSMEASEADPLAEFPLTTENQDASHSPVVIDARFDPKKMLPGGGWYRDDLRLTIAYRGSGHSDPVLRAAVEMLSLLPPSDPVRKRLLATRAVAACISCHPAASQETAAWKSTTLIGRRDNFTKFAHGPHLHIAELADCSRCHQVGTSVPGTPASITLTSDRASSSQLDEFKPMTRETCASCHTAKAAGDNCTKCHRYHIDF